jgi:outer membrane receptor for ferrienterochelin and colicin
MTAFSFSATHAAWGVLPLACALACASAAAQTTTLADTIVTATRTPTRADALTADVVTIEADTLARSGARTLSEVLVREAGLQMTSNKTIGPVHSRHGSPPCAAAGRWRAGGVFYVGPSQL